jgi:hypothetical protein
MYLLAYVTGIYVRAIQLSTRLSPLLIGSLTYGSSAACVSGAALEKEPLVEGLL